MYNIKILSERKCEHWPSFDVVYEWEDVMAKELSCPIDSLYFTNRVGREIRKILAAQKLTEKDFHIDDTVKLKWVMNAGNYLMYTRKGIVPVFLDFPSDMVQSVKEATKRIPFYWVTAYDVYQRLQAIGSKNVYYMPLSVSDRYFTGIVPPKSIDVIQFGRKNPVLHQYMLEYCTKHANVEYVYQTENGSLTYISSVRGNLGRFDKRSDYIKMISSSRISLVSTPAKDSSRDFGGIDFVTPRFYESASQYCYMIGRYTQNEETKLLGLNQVCPDINSYEEFSYYLDIYLNNKAFSLKEEYNRFLDKNVTSRRCNEIKKVINAHG